VLKLLKNIIVFNLLALMFIRMMAMPVACISYNLNKKYITEKLCINKYRPSLNCNGQCFLKKQLDKANENEGKDNNGPVKTFSLDYFEEIMVFSFTASGICSKMDYESGPESYTSYYYAAIFHPPSPLA
jgi:hypothetical protein